MKRSSILLSAGAIVLGFFLIGSVLAVRLSATPRTTQAGTGTGAETTLGSPGTLALTAEGRAPETRSLGPGESVTLDLGTLDSLETEGSWKVVLVPGPAGKAVLTAPPASRFALAVRTGGGTAKLKVTDGPGADSWSGGEVGLQISVPGLKSVEASGAANLVLDGLKASGLSLRLAGASQVTGSGTVEALSLDLSGAVSVDFDRVAARRISLQGAGAGSLNLRSDGGPVQGEVSGTMNVRVAGNPSSLIIDASGLSAVTRG